MSLVGQHIGRYRIVEPLGQGGVSVVYNALYTSRERLEAIKVMHPHLAPRADIARSGRMVEPARAGASDAR